MINVTELRIGNFFYQVKKQREFNSGDALSALDRIRSQVHGFDSEIIYRVTSINRSGEIEVIVPNEETIKLQANELYPVSLTSELLRECGFRDKTLNSNDWNEKYLTIGGSIPIRISEYRAGTHFSIYVFDKNTNSNTFLRDLNYLHELQNIYFELTGQDLEIDLSSTKSIVS